MFIETHCHLDYLEKKPLDQYIQEAIDNKVEKIITISVEPDNLQKVKELSEKYPQVYFSQGTHPHDAVKFTPEAKKIILDNATCSKMVAIGEIGLDYYYNHSPKDIQIKVFKEHLEMAISLGKPVIIHSREADQDMMDILTEFAPRMVKKGVIHSFTSGKELAQTALDLGFYLGFNGIITFKNAQNVRDIVDICPVNRILLETDSPFLTPVPHRGKENNPAYLPFVYEKVCELKGLDPESSHQIFIENSQEIFQLHT